MESENKLLSMRPVFFRKIHPTQVNKQYTLNSLKYYLTLMCVKSHIRGNFGSILEGRKITDNSLITKGTLSVNGEVFSLAGVFSRYLEFAEAEVEGISYFYRDTMILARLARRVNSFKDITCPFTVDVLRLLQIRSDVSVYHELKLSEDLYIYFANAEYMVITNRGAAKVTGDSPKTINEFFVLVVRLGTLFEKALTNATVHMDHFRQIQLGRISSIPSTRTVPKISNMIFNQRFGPGDKIHWFYNDGISTTREMLSITYHEVSGGKRVSIPDNDWVEIKKQFGMPSLTPGFLDNFVHQKGKRNENSEIG